ncbi:UNVERIFIED_CONTAM: Spastin [Sesamum latifolium]|uniref:Spastin n=1 Tax=Sesamum latifolium TaxID=2727402 RepID=A0AAW2X9J5_9LAMI
MVADLRMARAASWYYLYGQGGSQRKAIFEEKIKVLVQTGVPLGITYVCQMLRTMYLLYEEPNSKQAIMSSSNSVSDGDKDQPQQATKKIKANNFYCFVNNGTGNQLINVPSPGNSPFIFTSSPAIRPATAHILRPRATPGPELQQRITLQNQVNQQRPRLQQLQQLALLPQQHQQPVQQVPQQVSKDENLKILKKGVSSEEEAIDVDLGVNTIKGPVEIEISFDNFPYYLSDRTKHYLIASYFIHMKHKVQTNKRKLQHVRHRVILSGPAGSEIYQETLAMALANHYGVKLLVLDCHRNLSALSSFGQPLSDDVLKFHLHPALLKHLRSTKYQSRSMNMPSFSNATSELSVSQMALPPLYEKSQNQTVEIGNRVIFTGLKYGSLSTNIASRYHSYALGPSFGNRGRVLVVVNHNSKAIGVRFDVPIPEGNDLGGLCEARHGFFCDGNEICLDVEDQIKPIFTPFKGFCAESRLIVFMKHAENCLKQNLEPYQGITSLVNKLPDSVFVIGSHIQRDCIGQKDQKLFEELKCKLNRDAELLKVRENIARLHHVLVQHELECKDIETLHVTDQKLTDENAEKVVKWALGHDLMAQPQNYSNLKLVISKESILYGLENLRAVQARKNSPKDIATDNDFEKRILEDVILHNQIGVKFDDIGAHDKIKDAMKEVVILPLQRPELFCKGQLRKPCRGILLFGPPGRGKTMLAKAVAAEAGANLLNISTASITSKWYGDSEKFVKAIFSLASKLAPSVVFIDEVDSLLGRRRELEHEITRKVKNEFMLNWDGLQTKEMERVFVLAATNRPFDLDEAVLRRMPRRFMVHLPDFPNRCKILKVILAKEDLSRDVDFNAIAHMTDGFSGSDLKNLCRAAAYRPVREILETDKKSPQGAEKKHGEIRPLKMEDFKHACDQIRASVSNESRSMGEMVRWNEMYGEGGSKKNATLSYYI